PNFSSTAVPRLPVLRESGELAELEFPLPHRSEAGRGVTNVTYNDHGNSRSVLYEGSLAEIYVPYMDPAEGWYHTTFMDLGEGNIWGSVASVLEPGADCPQN